MRVGGYDTAHHTKPIQFLPLTKPSGWYTVKLTDIKIGGKSIGVNADEVSQAGRRARVCIALGKRHSRLLLFLNVHTVQ